MFRKLFGRKKDPKVFVIGLDCAPPELLFQQWRHDLPNLGRLMDRGSYRELMSATPAITVPAWSSMTSSRDPGTLGFYGFRNRKDYTYENRYIATGAAVKEDRVWDILSREGKNCIVVGVPQTFPIKPLPNGYLISSFLTPTTTDPAVQWTHPASLRNEIEQLLHPETYDVDVPQFRTDDKEFLLEQLYAMCRKRYKTLRYLLDNKPWEFFMFVEMGVDRIHHAMWSLHDPHHRNYEPDGKYVNAIRDYYRYLDEEIGTLLERLPAETHIIVVSDHGVQAMEGGICINEWMRREGYLVLKEEPPTDKLTRLDELAVDWGQTTAWGDGGYYARIFVNLKGREPEGIVPQEEYETFRDKLAAHIQEIPAPDGSPLQTRVFKPEDIYQKVKNIPPDMLVYLDDLRWRSVGSFGHGDIYTFENDTGPDDANHAENGVWVYSPPAGEPSLNGRALPPAQLMDFAPTILDLFELEIPSDMQGSVIDKEA